MFAGFRSAPSDAHASGAGILHSERIDPRSEALCVGRRLSFQTLSQTARGPKELMDGTLVKNFLRHWSGQGGARGFHAFSQGHAILLARKLDAFALFSANAFSYGH